MPKVIISYRRTDSKDIAGRIRDRLVGHYGAQSGAVYMDIDDIPPGIDFRKHISDALGSGDILLPIIGPKWLGPSRGKRTRINEPNDPVRVEIETALERKLVIVPVLVSDASMPSADDLPDSIKDLAYRNAATVDGGQDFHLHMNRLIDSLDKLLPRPRGRPATRLVGRRWYVPIGGGIAAAAVLAGVLWFLPLPYRNDAPTGGPYIPVATDRPLPPPSPRKYFEANDSSLVYVEATGSARELVFSAPSPHLRAAGARPGDWLFVGRRIGNTYEGNAYFYVGACPDRRVAYAVKGPVIEEVTVEFSGNVPRIDLETCKQSRAVDDQLLYDEKKTVIKFKFER